MTAFTYTYGSQTWRGAYDSNFGYYRNTNTTDAQFTVFSPGAAPAALSDVVNELTRGISGFVSGAAPLGGGCDWGFYCGGTTWKAGDSMSGFFGGGHVENDAIVFGDPLSTWDHWWGPNLVSPRQVRFRHTIRMTTDAEGRPIVRSQVAITNTSGSTRSVGAAGAASFLLRNFGVVWQENGTDIVWSRPPIGSDPTYPHPPVHRIATPGSQREYMYTPTNDWATYTASVDNPDEFCWVGKEGMIEVAGLGLAQNPYLALTHPTFYVEGAAARDPYCAGYLWNAASLAVGATRFVSMDFYLPEQLGGWTVGSVRMR